MAVKFQEWPKIPRYRRECAVTEKLDGTSSCIVWAPANTEHDEDQNIIATRDLIDQHGSLVGPHHLLTQSRQRFIVPGRIRAKSDNYSFAQWCDDRTDDLMRLGPGYHYGEFWGFGIQRGYGMAEKHFSLFNVSRWGEGKQERPACCDVVPLLGYVLPSQIEEQLERLRVGGSLAAPGYQRPEGIVVWHSQSKSYFKILIEGDDVPKGQSV